MLGVDRQLELWENLDAPKNEGAGSPATGPVLLEVPLETLKFVLKVVATILAAVIAFLETQGGNPLVDDDREAALVRSIKEAAESILSKTGNLKAS